MPGEIYLTGNTGIDALLATGSCLPAPRRRKDNTPRLLVTCHRRENWGEPLKSIAAALIELARDRALRIDFVLHPNPGVAETMRALLGGNARISLVEPCTHAELVTRLRDADLALSDSGGFQEEAPALGTPLLVLRSKTERPEVLASGNALLVGTSTDRIMREVRRLLDNPMARAAMSRPSWPYGDGQAARRIGDIIQSWLATRCGHHSDDRLSGNRPSADVPA